MKYCLEKLLIKIIDFLGCGKIEKVSTRLNSAVFVVYKFNNHCEKIIPFFQNYPLQGIKSIDFIDFCKIAYLMKNKIYLTSKGIE